MKKIAVVLSGCGVYDGAEIHEATLSLLAIAKLGASYQVFAPNVDQHHVVNHINGEDMKETRNVLVESARIARGQIKDLKEFKADDFDGLLFPGGFGVAKNMTNWAFQGAQASILPGIKESLLSMAELKKPIGALCIAPVLFSMVFGEVDLTIGDAEDVVEQMEKLGSNHVIATHGEVVVDFDNKLLTTPCYMLDATITQIAEGAENMVDAMLKLMD